MSWLGKMIGGTIGFALGGPLGAVAGAAFGHTFVDKKEQAYLSSRPGTQQMLSSNEQAQLVFFTAAFSMLAKISKADGKVSDNEISAVETFMKRDLQLDLNSQQTAINIFRQAVTSPESFDAFALQFYSVFRTQPNIIDLMMDVMLRVSTADGSISNEEEALLLSATRIFNYSTADFERLKSKYVKQTNKYYAVLKCDETASNEEIKKQYRKLVSEYHPDKIEAKGLPEEFIKFANDKFKEIQEAYDTVKKERGL
ncbi:MAG: TerB family tellurite resistance protein [Proteobacteria bacterium]|nr:TerB family tellurite resistance protein [Pseudomonadota bacterium]MBU1582753.1 TerB family tellurite resistance protein [Pseudomonadota bacterium]MBU2630221.1 TerB family tellurite resistance protein [Pseudomonadota bacterium]